ncbi:MAG TPA: acyl-[ACP]--phospholipid O-acyltransferase [Dongiaceae bacterium]|nr:acyl-[ACP]--phospholipid O-acyltransferase [Dongiaceae bacterium]
MQDRSYWRLIRDPGFSWMLASQFLGAFNVNVYTWAITFFALDLASRPDAPFAGTTMVGIIGAVFIVPYLLFSDYAGQLADHVTKRTVLIVVKSFEIVVMVSAVAAFWLADMRAMLVVAFFMGTQAALYSPAKYGSLPELLPDRDISRGNALIEMSTFLAIILGSALGGVIYQAFHDRMPIIGLILLAIAIVGTACAFGIGRTHPRERGRRPFSWNPAGTLAPGLRQLYRNRRLWLTVLGLSYFWFIGALVQKLVTVFAVQTLGMAPTETTPIGLLGVALAVGIGIGSLVAGRLSGHKVELGLVPIGAIGITIGALVLATIDSSYAATMACLGVLGFFGGMYSVPLNAMLQQKSDEDKRGQVIAANNIMNTTGILLAAGVMVLAGFVGASPNLIAALAGLLTLAVIAYLLILLPDFLIRFCLWMLTHSIYRIRIVGPENVPLNGPALLVANHLSFIDGLLVGACVQRFVRFMVYAPFFKMPLLGKLFTLMRAIPTGGGGARGALGAIKRAREELQAGHVVCIFAEGAISRTGNMLPFKRGFEKIIEGIDVPIIPVHLDQVWGSIFSFKDGRFFWKWPVRLFYPVTITFGKPLPGSARAWDVRQKLLEMGGDAFRHRRKKVDLVHRRFVAQAKHSWRRFAMTDSLGQTANFGEALTGAFLLARKLDQALPRANRNVGVLLPASVGAALVNMGLLLAGRVPVNLNFTIGPEAMQAAVDKAGITHIVAARPFLSKAKLAERPGMVFVEDFLKSIGKGERVFWYLTLRLLPVSWIERLAGGGNQTPDDLCTIMFSSGSTGTPKGVMLSHHNIMSNLEAIAQILWIQPDDRMMGVLPFFHSFGFTGTLCLPLLCGIGAIYHPNPLDAKTIGKLAREHGATILISTPTFCQAYYRTCGPEDFKTLRHVVVGAERLRPDFAAQFKEKFGLDMLEGYGATEMGPVVSVNVPNVVHQGAEQVGHKPGTVGHPLPGVAAKVVDPETGRDLSEGQEGLLLLKGPGRMVGYLADEKATAAALRDEWYVTGDIAIVDEDGFIKITDRLSRFSKIGGEMVPHLKVEEAMLRVPGVEAACVTAVPDPQRGERLVGFYVANEAMAPQLVWQALGETDLPKIFIPKATDLRRIETLPVLGSGKIDLRAVKALAVAAE